jgi:hypothetical protein
LEPHIAVDARYNSRKRKKEHASICETDTRTQMIQTIEEWFYDSEQPLCWLHGHAGTGKSTIAHTIAHLCRKNLLAATFFFSRARENGDHRGDISKLIPTLAYQIAEFIPLIRAKMHAVLQDNPTLLTQTIQDQFSKLIAEPLLRTTVPGRLLVIIDGLDECQARDSAIELIRSLGETTSTCQFPLRFLLTSRGERDIEATFNSLNTGNTRTVLPLTLRNSKDDVRTYLRSRLLKIRKDHHLIMQNEPESWPRGSDLEQLVTNSEGFFLYASTAVKFIGDGNTPQTIGDENAPPQEKLRTILAGQHVGVDGLYTQVITEAQRMLSDNLRRVMGSLMYVRYPLSVDELAQLLELDASHIRVALDQCQSIFVIPSSNSEVIRPHHPSLRDFLTSQERSQNLCCAPAEYHARLMIQCSKAITNAFRNNEIPPEYACVAWFYHGSSLLFQASPSLGFHPLFREAKVQMKDVNLEWLRYWMVEALSWAGLDYIRLDLPSSTVSWQPMSKGTFSIPDTLRSACQQCIGFYTAS